MTATILYDNASQMAFLTFTFLNATGVPADPTAVSCLVTDPSGTAILHTYLGTAPADITKPLVGKYALSVSCTPNLTGVEGLWSYQWVGTGTAVVNNVQPGTFRVFSPSIGNAYAGLEELKDRLGITDSSDDYAAQQALQASAGWINEYCIVPETPILTAALQWVPAGSLNIGDEIVGVDEYPTGPKFPKRHYRRAVVAAVPRRMTACTKITMEDGREVITAASHRWLARSSHGKGGTVYAWMHADAIQPGYEIAAPLRTWPEETSFDAGWASGIFDGEGWLHRARGNGTGAHAAVAQNPGAVLDRILGYLKEADIPYSARSNGNGSGQVCRRIDIGARSASMELLGRLQPCRLMPRSAEVWEGGQVTGSLRVVSAEPAGVREVVSLGTSTGTYIANGLVSHNCGQHFYRITETRTFVPHNLWQLDIDPLVTITALNVDQAGTGDGTFAEAWVKDVDYQLKLGTDLYNTNFLGVPRPYKKVQVLQSGRWFPYTYPYSHFDRVQIVGTWGWPAVPAQVAQANLVLGAQWFKEKDAPFGVAGVSDYGVIRIQSNPWLIEMLRPYTNPRHKVGV